MGTKTLSVVVPAYKQQKTINKDLLLIRQVLETTKSQYEIICVVDGFVDNTFQNAAKLTSRYKNIKVIGYEINRGKGYAIRYGMANSSGEIVSFIDAGMDISPSGLLTMLHYFSKYKADVIIGSKRHPGTNITYPWQRKFLSFFYQYLNIFLFGLSVKDTQVGLKGYTRKVISELLPRLKVEGFACDIEMLALSNYLGFKKIYEIPVDISLRWQEGSNVTGKRFLRTALKIFFDTLEVFINLKLNYYSNKNRKNWDYNQDLNFNIQNK